MLILMQKNFLISANIFLVIIKNILKIIIFYRNNYYCKGYSAINAIVRVYFVINAIERGYSVINTTERGHSVILGAIPLREYVFRT